MIRRYVEQILNLYNFIDGLVVCNKDGFVEYYTTFRPDINSLTESDVLEKHILSIYPDVDPEESSIFRVLKTGEPIFNEFQYLRNNKNESIYAINTTLPIKADNSDIIGVVEVSRYLDNEYIRKDITLIPKRTEPVRDSKGLYTLADINTNSTSIEKIKEIIERIADTSSSVMIFGETGTGKELIAQSIHTQGSRHSGPFISQNCAAIPSTLLESILFGTEKGSYTGAISREGLFELANGGTLFLDEINSMEFAMQAKILKAIEEKTIRRVGSNKTITLDVRILSATNQNPHEAIQQEKMRKDLFYRLATVLIEVPPLRDRKEDIRHLTKCFIQSFNESMNKQVIDVTEDVEKIFDSYPWFGNVRELKNVIEGSFNLLSGRFIKKSDLPQYIQNTSSYSLESINNDFNLSLVEKVENFERNILIEAIKMSRTSAEAANRLKITRQALNYKLNKYKLKF